MVRADDLGLTFREGAGESEARMRLELVKLAAAGRPDVEDARAVAMTRTAAERVSKFLPCLPPAMAADLLVERLFDVETARAVVREA